MSSIAALAQIIASGVATIEAGCANKHVQYPSLDDDPTPESLAIQDEFSQNALPVIAAAHQLMATLMPPHSYYQKLLYGVSCLYRVPVVVAHFA